MPTESNPAEREPNWVTMYQFPEDWVEPDHTSIKARYVWLKGERHKLEMILKQFNDAEIPKSNPARRAWYDRFQFVFLQTMRAKRAKKLQSFMRLDAKRRQNERA